MKVLHDTWLLFVESVRETLRYPVWTIIALFQPLCYLFLFAPLLQPISSVRGFPPGGALTVFVPGVLVMLGIFSTAFRGFSLILDLQQGVIERLRVTPVSHWALLLGRVLRDMLLLLVQALLLVVVALPLGVHVSLPGLGLLLLLLALLGLCLASCSYALALTLKDVNALSPVLNTISLPVLLLSGITLPLTLAPPVIRTIASFNPFAYVVSAARQLFNGHLIDGVVMQSFVIMTVLTLAALLWASRLFRHATA